MQKLHYETIINAPKEKVWDTMLNDATYRQWTDVFNPEGGSYFEGDWSAGTDMKFIGPEKDGTVSGMYSTIKENRPYEFVSVQHLGEIQKGVEKPWAMDVESGIFENYTFTEIEGGTKLDIDMDAPEEFSSMFDAMWPKALETLKALAEA